MKLSECVREFIAQNFTHERGMIAELCREAGVDQAIVSRFLSGKGTPSLKTIDKLLDAAKARLTISIE